MGIMNILGIILRPDLRFSSTLFAKIAHSEFSNTELRSLYAQHVDISNHVVTTDNLDLPQNIFIPHVLIASPCDRVDLVLVNVNQTTLQKYGFHQDIYSVPPLNSKYLAPLNSLQEPSERKSCQCSTVSRNNLPDLVNERNSWYRHILCRTLDRSDPK